MNNYRYNQTGSAAIMILILLFGLIWSGLMVGGILYLKNVKVQKSKEDTKSELYLEYSSMLDELKEKKELLSEKEKMLRTQAQRIDELEEELNIARNTLDGIQNEMSTYLVEIEETEKKNLRKLAKVYGLMEPAQAVAIISGLDDETIVNILMNMKERQAARLMGAFATLDSQSQKRAALISERMRTLTVSSSTKK